MKIRAFAFTLMFGALLCLAPSATALDDQPEDLAPDAFSAVESADAAGVEQPVLPEEPADLLEEVPTLPQTGTPSGFVSVALCSVGGLLIAAGIWLTRHTA